MIVLDSTRPVVAAARSVQIDDQAVRRWALAARPSDFDPPASDLLAELPGTRAQLANLVLLIDALNFCFWGDPPPTVEWRGTRYTGFNAMLVALLRIAHNDERWSDARFWCDVPAAELRGALSPRGDLPLLDERDRIVRETGAVLLSMFDGQFANAAESVNFRAWDLAALLLVSFPSFRDVGAFRGQPIYFAKRAQIAALDTARTWTLHDYDPLVELDALTAFADYRVPQTLRHLGILVYAPELGDRIDRKDEIAAGGELEIELRAATIWAVERMRIAAGERGVTAAAWQIDAHLWRRAHDPHVKKPHHRTRTTFY